MSIFLKYLFKLRSLFLIKERNTTQITEGVFFIPGQDEMIPDAHVYVIGRRSSKDLTLIDAGLMGKDQYKLQAILKLGIEFSDIKRVIMTHTHLDHLGCLPGILKELPNAELWMHVSESEPLERGDDRIVLGLEMFREMCQAQFGINPGDFALKVDRKLESGETLTIGGMSWDVLHIPGHSPGCIGFYNRPGKILIPGDVVYANHAIGRFDLFGADGPHLYNSLLKLAELEVNILLPGHNRIVEDLPAGYIHETAREWRRTLNSGPTNMRYIFPVQGRWKF